jgi:menaquinone-dependent protoporphyrinogen IX oxidase
MNVGILVYSHTGHTLAVAEKLKEALSAAGHTVDLERLETVGAVALAATDVQLKNVPPIDGYQALVLGTAVRGGQPAPAMAGYMVQLPSLEGMQVACLATGFFPAQWGRNQTLAKMAELCASKGATVCGSESVRWPSLRRKRRTAEVVKEMAGLFPCHRIDEQ